MDNPFWTVLPILVSVFAVWFAYKSTLITREVADVHVRVLSLVATAYSVPQWTFERDGNVYVPGITGSREDFEQMVVGTPVGVAINSLHIEWTARSWGGTTENYDPNQLPYTQAYHYLMLTNDSGQIAEGFTVRFNRHEVEDPDALRGRQPVPEGSRPTEWVFGPAVIAPNQNVLIPLGTSFMRYDPSFDDEDDFYRYWDVQYFGEFFEPVSLSYTSSISGVHRMDLDFDSVFPILGAFENPPENSPVGEEARQALEDLQTQVSRQSEEIVQNLAPEADGQAEQGDGEAEGEGTADGRPPKSNRSR